MQTVAIGATVVLGAAIIGMVVAIVVQRGWLMLRDARARDARARLQPHVIDFVGTPGAAAANELWNARGVISRGELAKLFARYRILLRGEEQERIQVFLSDAGYVADAERDLRSHSPWKRSVAARSLGDFGDDHSLRPLANALQDDGDPLVRLTAARALGKFSSPTAATALREALERGDLPPGVVAAAMYNVGAAAVPELTDLATCPDPHLRSLALQLLRHVGMGTPLGERPAQIAANAALHDEEDEVRASAVELLGAVGGERFESCIEAALLDTDETVRAAACRGASDMFIPSALPRLRTLAIAKHQPAFVRRAAAAAVASIEFAPQQPDDSDSDPYVLEARALAKLGVQRR
jgi:hypothetical protein